VAARGNDEVAARALAVLDDPNRSFVTSDFVRLEVVPKPVYFGRTREAKKRRVRRRRIRAEQSAPAFDDAD